MSLTASAFDAPARAALARSRDLKDLGGWKSGQTVAAVYPQRMSQRSEARYLALDAGTASGPTGTRNGRTAPTSQNEILAIGYRLRGLIFEMGPGGVEPPTSRLSGVLRGF